MISYFLSLYIRNFAFYMALHRKTTAAAHKILANIYMQKRKEGKKLHNRLQYHFGKFNYKFLLEMAILKPLVTSLGIFYYTCLKMVI